MDPDRDRDEQEQVGPPRHATDARDRADAVVRATLSLADAALRASYVASVVRAWPIETLAAALDVVCERALQQADADAREALLAIVDALNADGMHEVLRRLREQAAGESLLGLERLVRHPLRTGAVIEASKDRVPDYGKGRPLTLGERKALARRPDPDLMQKLMADPHPDVIRGLLCNPRLTEDDVVRLAAKRPGRGDVLSEIARFTKWAHRPRVRMAIVMNPATPPEIATRICGLLVRQELRLVAESPAVTASVRAVCVEHLKRRPPVESEEPGDDTRVH